MSSHLHSRHASGRRSSTSSVSLAASRRRFARRLAQLSLAALLFVSLYGLVATSTTAFATQPGFALQPTSGGAGQDRLQQLRRDMVELQIRERGILQPDLLRALGDVPRHEFVPESLRDRAYADEPLPIRDSDTAPESISQPYLSARMIELLDVQPSDRVLEIGTGSGYDAALLSRLAKEVFTVEIDQRLAERARERLAKLRYDNVTVRVGDGYRGLPEEAPFDAILLTTAPLEIPEHLVEQLEIGGKMVVPVGSFVQELLVITRTPSGEQTRTIMPIRVSSMKGRER